MEKLHTWRLRRVQHSAGGCDGRATPRSGAEAGRTPCPKDGSQEELRHPRGQGQRPRVPDCDGTGTAERSYCTSEVRGGGQEELPLAPKPEARGSRREELPHAPTPKTRGSNERSDLEPWLRGRRRA